MRKRKRKRRGSATTVHKALWLPPLAQSCTSVHERCTQSLALVPSLSFSLSIPSPLSPRSRRQARQEEGNLTSPAPPTTLRHLRSLIHHTCRRTVFANSTNQCRYSGLVCSSHRWTCAVTRTNSTTPQAHQHFQHHCTPQHMHYT